MSTPGTPGTPTGPTRNRLRMTAAALLWVASSAGNQAQASEAALAQCRLETVAAKRLACYDAIPADARSAATAATPQPAAPAPAGASRFGLPSPAGETVESRIASRFEGWGPKTRFTLANGQVWEVEDGSSASLWLDNPEVRVRRGFAGAYYLEIEGTNRSPRVRRLN